MKFIENSRKMLKIWDQFCYTPKIPIVFNKNSSKNFSPNQELFSIKEGQNLDFWNFRNYLMTPKIIKLFG
jgi:hypothetical protein